MAVSTEYDSVIFPVTAGDVNQLHYETIKDLKVSQPHIGLVTAFAKVRVLGTRVELMSVA